MGNLPPVEPPDLRRNRNRDDQDDDNYPPRGNYPPQGNYPPPQPSGSDPIDLDSPRNRETYPPPQRGPQYPPQGDYPPRQQGGTGPIDLDDPHHGGAPQRRERQPSQRDYPPPQRGGTGPVDLDEPQYSRRDKGMEMPRERIDLDDPRFGGSRRPRDEMHEDRGRRSDRRRREQAEPPDRRRPDRSASWGLSERQVEYLAWGITVVLLGVSLIQAVTGSTGLLRFFFPLLAGAILMGSALYQRVVQGWHVGPMTWLMAILLLSYTITLMVSGDDTGIFKWIAYFIGTLIIMTGLILLLQVFRRQ